MANPSILAAFERMWQHILSALGGKADIEHNHDSMYYTEAEIDSKLETKSDITHNHDSMYYTETEIDSRLETKSDITHNHDSAYDTKGSASATLAEAKSYADSAATKVKNDLLNNAGAAYDTLKELGDLIDDNTDAIDALETIAAGKADQVHIHSIADVTNLQSTLDGKAASSHGTHVTYSTTNPVMDGTASVGSASTVARSDHKHPVDTSRASKTEFDTHDSDTTKHITSAERSAWNAKSNFSGNYNDLTNKPSIPSINGLATIQYVDDKVANAGSGLPSFTTADNGKFLRVVNGDVAWQAIPSAEEGEF